MTLSEILKLNDDEIDDLYRKKNDAGEGFSPENDIYEIKYETSTGINVCISDYDDEVYLIGGDYQGNNEWVVKLD